ncbi:hypothetical protein [Comamonas sp.]|nr:hypothetical protein [Comamonas sp.]
MSLYLLHHNGHWRAKFAPSLKKALHFARKHFKSNQVIAVQER